MFLKPVATRVTHVYLLLRGVCREFVIVILHNLVHQEMVMIQDPIPSCHSLYSLFDPTGKQAKHKIRWEILIFL